MVIPRGKLSFIIFYPQFSSSGEPSSDHVNMSLDLSYIPNQELGNSKINKDEKKNFFILGFMSLMFIIMKHEPVSKSCLG